MNRTRKRALTWSLVAIGVVMLAIAGVLLATFPGPDRAGFGRYWAQGQTQGQVQGQDSQPAPQVGPQSVPPWAQGPGYWYGRPYGWFMHGPRFFGGGLLIVVLLVLVVSLFARRWRYWGHAGSERRVDAEEILRRAFAEGRITEEEFKRRLGALRE